MLTEDILSLPMDILVIIFMKLRPPDLRNVMLTCRILRDIIKNDNRIWRNVTRESLISQDNTGNIWFNKLSWYERCKFSNNWLNGCFKSKTLIRHYTNYMPWLKFHNSEILLLSIGSEVISYRTDITGLPNCNKPLWKVDVPKIVRHDVRTNDVSRFIFKNNILLCGNRDGCVAVYNVKNVQKRPKLECHIKDCIRDGQVEVSAVEFIKNRDQLSVVAGSSDSPVLLLCNIKNQNEAVEIPNSNNNIKYISLRNCLGTKCLSLNSVEDKLAIGINGNSQPLLLDMNVGQLLMTAEDTENHRHAVKDIQWHNYNTIAYVTHSGHLQLIDARSHQVVYKARDPFQSSLYCIKTDSANGIVVGSAEYSRCVLFDARQSSHHVQMYFTQRNTSPVYCLDFDSTKLITAVDRGVAVLNFNIEPFSQERKDYSHHVFH